MYVQPNYVGARFIHHYVLESTLKSTPNTRNIAEAMHCSTIFKTGYWRFVVEIHKLCSDEIGPVVWEFELTESLYRNITWCTCICQFTKVSVHQLYTIACLSCISSFTPTLGCVYWKHFFWERIPRLLDKYTVLWCVCSTPKNCVCYTIQPWKRHHCPPCVHQLWFFFGHSCILLRPQQNLPNALVINAVPALHTILLLPWIMISNFVTPRLV